jgi:hypothetical protein
MADWDSVNTDRAVEAAWANLENEARKLTELGKHWDEASTVVRAKDHSLEMTFDGRGELADLTFNASKYRAMAPAQLAAVIVETLRAGRVQAQQKMADLMGTEDIPGLDLNGIASGAVRPDDVVEALLGPMFKTLNDFGIDSPMPKNRNA